MADDILERLIWTHYDLEQFPDATRWCDEAAKRFPKDHRFVLCHLWLLITPAAVPDVRRAWELAQHVAATAPANSRDLLDHLARLIVGGVIGRARLLDSARSVLVGARATAEIDPEHELEGYEAAMRTLIGHTDEAVALLRRYVALNPGHSFNVDRDLHWWWRPLRDHPGFRAVTAPSR